MWKSKAATGAGHQITSARIALDKIGGMRALNVDRMATKLKIVQMKNTVQYALSVDTER